MNKRLKQEIQKEKETSNGQYTEKVLNLISKQGTRIKDTVGSRHMLIRIAKMKTNKIVTLYR